MTALSVERLFKEQVKPVLGCTEPSSVALAVSAAFNILKEKSGAAPRDIEKIVLTLDKYVFRNALAVGIPRTNGSYGIETAASVGVFCKPGLQLKLFSSFDRKNIPAARQLTKKIKIKVLPLEEIYIKSEITAGNNTASAVVEKTHIGISSIKFNKQTVFKNTVLKKNTFSEEMKKIAFASLSEIIETAKKIKPQEKNIIKNLIATNWHAAEYGISKKCGLSVGQVLKTITGQKTVIDYTQVMTAAACDVRMIGENVEIMSVCGSGNQGIMCSVPLVAVAKKLNIPQKKVIEAVTVSILVECKLTYLQGYLTSLCGAVTKAGFAAVAGLSYLLGASVEKIENAMKIFAADITGIVCDGAKPSCALKLASSSASAVKSALFSVNGVSIHGNQGIIIKSDFNSTLKNVAGLKMQLN
ncbi:MAG: L-serine ammonia-lyase, iron-sulfur-dependent, subunit alpha [Elusimicrobiota bacterium]